MHEEVIPYWAQCNKCDSWRQLDQTVKSIDKEFNENFVCSQVSITFLNIIWYIVIIILYIFFIPAKGKLSCSLETEIGFSITYCHAQK